MSIRYQNFQTPGLAGRVTLLIERTAPDPDRTASPRCRSRYEILADGSGEIAFTLVGNIIAGTAIETVPPRPVAADWRRQGDPGGRVGRRRRATQTECWDATFAVTYNDKPWSTTEDVTRARWPPSARRFPTLP